MSKIEINCKNCIRFKTCKFVEQNKEYTKQMYDMFKYAEWNNLNNLFYNNASKCQYFIDDKINTDELIKTIETAKYQMEWIGNYLKGDNGRLDESFIIENLKKTVDKYKAYFDSRVPKVVNDGV